MHEIRSALLSGEGGGRASPLIAPKRGRDKAEANSGSLTAIPVKRQQTRSRNERKEERLHGVVDAAILHFDGCKYDARVVNVSSQGTMVETTFSPWIGDSIQVQFADCNPTDCVVRWVRGGRLGLEFAEGTTILASLKIKKQIFGSAAVDRAQDGDKLQRPMASRPHRHGLTWTGTLYWSYEAFSVRLRNISTDGAMLEGPCSLEVGSKVRLNLAEAGTVSGEIRWCEGGQVGVKFDEKFNLRHLARSRPDGPFLPNMTLRPQDPA